MNKLALALGAVLVLSAACLSPAAKEAHDAFIAAYQDATADGIVTEAEAASLKELFSVYAAEAKQGASDFDWNKLLWSLGTILAGGGALRMLPNSAILGREAASKLVKPGKA